MKMFFSLLLAAVIFSIVAASGAMAADLSEGRYMISVSTSSKMFRASKCEIVVRDGKPIADITLGGDGFGYLFAGTGESADAAGEAAWSPARVVERGKHSFFIPVPAFDVESDLAAWSIKYKKWYDYKVVFHANTLRKKFSFSYDGGTGRTKIWCEDIEFKGASCLAKIVFDSENFTRVVADGREYIGEREDGRTTFVLPVALGGETKIEAETVAMSAPHMISYTLRVSDE